MSIAETRVSMPPSSPAKREVGSFRLIPIVAFGLSLSFFFAFSFVVCILGYLALPGLPVDHAALTIFLPGFTLLSWGSFCLGLFESFLFGWYTALVFGLVYNFCVRQMP